MLDEVSVSDLAYFEYHLISMKTCLSSFLFKKGGPKILDLFLLFSPPPTEHHMPSTMPHHTVADIFFYNELSCSLGHVHADHWLATASSASPSQTVFQWPTSVDDTCGKKSQESNIARLMNEHGDKAFFTDTAHELLDSPRSVVSN
jgi:hypothetical protein